MNQVELIKLTILDPEGKRKILIEGTGEFIHNLDDTLEIVITPNKAIETTKEQQNGK